VPDRGEVWPRTFFRRRRQLQMKAMLRRFVREEAGQDLIEYGLLIGIITVGAIGAITAIGPKVAIYFSNLNNNLP
jgi:Flp pilus assembly pilin Flp